MIDLCRFLAAQGLLYFYNFRSAKSENEREETEAQPEMRRGGCEAGLGGSLRGLGHGHGLPTDARGGAGGGRGQLHRQAGDDWPHGCSRLLSLTCTLLLGQKDTDFTMEDTRGRTAQDFVVFSKFVYSIPSTLDGFEEKLEFEELQEMLLCSLVSSAGGEE